MCHDAYGLQVIESTVDVLSPTYMHVIHLIPFWSQ
jgi:hypothetical protein